MGGCGPSKHNGTTANDAATAASGSDLPNDEVIQKILKIRSSNPENLMAKHIDPDYYNSLSEAEKPAFLQVCKSGIDNADSGMGCCKLT